MLTETQYPALFGAKSLPAANKPKKTRRAKPDLADRLKKAAKPGAQRYPYDHGDGGGSC